MPSVSLGTYAYYRLTDVIYCIVNFKVEMNSMFEGKQKSQPHFKAVLSNYNLISPGVIIHYSVQLLSDVFARYTLFHQIHYHLPKYI